MRKLIVALFVVCLSAVFTLAANTGVIDTTQAVRTGGWVHKMHSTPIGNATSVGWDSLFNADSAIIASNWNPPKGRNGSEWLLIHAPFGGNVGAADSVSMAVKVFSYDRYDSLLYVTTVDSFVSNTTGEIANLQLGGTVFGHKFTIKVVAADGADTLQLNRMYLIERNIAPSVTPFSRY